MLEAEAAISALRDSGFSQLIGSANLLRTEGNIKMAHGSWVPDTSSCLDSGITLKVQPWPLVVVLTQKVWIFMALLFLWTRRCVEYVSMSHLIGNNMPNFQPPKLDGYKSCQDSHEPLVTHCFHKIYETWCWALLLSELELEGFIISKHQHKAFQSQSSWVRLELKPNISHQ
jgi:hypothetical protein